MTKVKVFSAKSNTRSQRSVQVAAGRSLVGALKCCCESA
jgi:hypothetical protein